MLIGIGGNPLSGKSMIAAHLKMHGFRVVELIDPIRDLVSKKYGIPRENMEGKLKDAIVSGLGKSPRDLLRKEAELARRDSDNGLLPHSNILDCDSETVVPGIRTHAEANLILGKGGKLIRMIRLSTTPEILDKPILWDRLSHMAIVNDGSSASACNKVMDMIKLGYVSGREIG